MSIMSMIIDIRFPILPMEQLKVIQGLMGDGDDIAIAIESND